MKRQENLLTSLFLGKVDEGLASFLLGPDSPAERGDNICPMC